VRAWSGFFTVGICNFCRVDGFGPDTVLCTECHSIACSLCAEEMRSNAATPNSHRFAARADKLAACNLHGPAAHVRQCSLGFVPFSRSCDLCNKSLGWGMQWLTSLRASGDTNDLSSRA
jgi:hypothetical protein